MVYIYRDIATSINRFLGGCLSLLNCELSYDISPDFSDFQSQHKLEVMGGTWNLTQKSPTVFFPPKKKSAKKMVELSGDTGAES